MFEIRSCYYYKSLRMLKFVGTVENEDVTRAEVYMDDEKIGEVNLNTYVIDIARRAGSKELNWCFSKVVDYSPNKRIVIKAYVGNSSKILEVKDIIIQDESPTEFISTIGKKNGLTVNGDAEKEARYVEKVRREEYKTPISLLHIEISSNCNLECKYCIVSNGYNLIERGFISDAVLDRAIEGINELKTIKNIQISALGEPTLNPQLVNICERIYKETYVRNIQFFTNGMLFDRKLSDEISKLPLNFKITFSVDGHTPEENNSYRKGSDYEKVKKNIKYFLKKIEKKDNFWVRIHNLQINSQDDEDITPPEFLLNDFGNIQIDAHRPFTFPSLLHHQLQENGICVYAKAHKKICKRTFAETTIRHNGDVIRCHWDSKCEVVMGNILESSLKDIWLGDAYIEQRKKMMPEVPFDQLPEVCKRCHAMNEGFLYKAEK